MAEKPLSPQVWLELKKQTERMARVTESFKDVEIYARQVNDLLREIRK